MPRVTERQSVLQKRSKRQARGRRASEAHSECHWNLSARVALRNFSRDNNFEERRRSKTLRVRFGAATSGRDPAHRIIFWRVGFLKNPAKTIGFASGAPRGPARSQRALAGKMPALLCHAAETVLCSGSACPRPAQAGVQTTVRGAGKPSKHERKMKNLSYNRFLAVDFWMLLAGTVTFLLRPAHDL